MAAGAWDRKELPLRWWLTALAAYASMVPFTTSIFPRYILVSLRDPKILDNLSNEKDLLDTYLWFQQIFHHLFQTDNSTDLLLVNLPLLVQ